MSENVDNAKSMHAVGIDLGGTKIRAAIVSDGELVSEAIQVETPETPEQILESLVSLINQLKNDSIRGVGIATAGTVNSETGQVVGSTGNLPGWAGTHVKEIIESKVNIPVQVENDANAAAYGESKVDQLKDKHCIVVVTLGTGIGGGIVIDGELYRGQGWGAGEIGHMKIDMTRDRLCTCGAYGCWEVYGCGRGLELTAIHMIKDAEKIDSHLIKEKDDITTYSVIEAYKAGDSLALDIIEKWHEHLGFGFANLNHVLNPDCYVITGGLSEFCDLVLLRKYMLENTLHNMGDSVELRSSVKGSDAGLIGAAQSLVDSLVKKSGSTPLQSRVL